MKRYFTIFVSIVFFTLVFSGGYMKSDLPKKKDPTVNAFPPLIWKKGDWWIVQTRFLANQARMLDAPEKLGFFSYYHLFQVTGKEQLAGKECLVIEIRPLNVPPEERNDQGTDYLWRLYLSSKDMTLCRLIINTRMGPYLISGDITKDTIDYMSGNPVVVAGTPLLVPLDIPKLPFQQLPPYMLEENREINFFDEHNMQQYIQYASIINIFGKDAVLYIKIWDTKKELRSQLWKPGLPWWSQWRLETTGPYQTGIFDASLVKWGTINNVPAM
jgi:hypothetical protein